MQKMTATQRTALAIVTTARAHATMGLAIVFLIAANRVGATRVNAGAIPATAFPTAEMILIPACGIRCACPAAQITPAADRGSRRHNRPQHAIDLQYFAAPTNSSNV